MQNTYKRIDKSLECVIMRKTQAKEFVMKKIIMIAFMILGSLFAFAETKEGAAMGFKDEIRVSIDVQGGKIISIEVSHRDPERVAKPAIEELKQEILKKQSVEVDDIAGATATSQGFREAVKKAMEK